MVLGSAIIAQIRIFVVWRLLCEEAVLAEDVAFLVYNWIAKDLVAFGAEELFFDEVFFGLEEPREGETLLLRRVDEERVRWGGGCG